MARRIVAVLTLLVIAAVLFVAAVPQAFGLTTTPIIAQVVSLRALDVVVALGLILILGVTALIWRRVRRFFAAIVVLLLVFCIATAGILGARGFGHSTHPATAAGNITVLEWNTRGDAPGAAEIAKLALDEKVDIVALPETTLITGKQVAELMKADGRPMWVYSLAYDYISKARSTTLLISSALGRYTATNVSRTTSVLPTVIAKPNTATAPTIIAVHVVSPKQFYMRNWRNDLDTLSALCTGSNTIMVGDYNSTLDALQHYSAKAGDDFGDCRDSALADHAASVGSWPTSVPSLFGAQIDHVLSTPNWKTTSMRVITTQDSAGSDHRPILVTLAPNG